MVETLFAYSPDGTKIAFECSGSGKPLILIHGGGGSRFDWHEVGYIKPLEKDFTVISLDLRGHGQSDLPTKPEAYTTEKLGQDILAVADACGCRTFDLWAMSYGAKISRYLAVQSDRISRFVMMGAQLGLGVSGQLRQDAVNFIAHWPPILQAQQNGVLDFDSLAENDQEMLRSFDIPVMLAWVAAMLEWPSVEPADFRCPTLWLAGSEDDHAVNSIKEYEELLPDLHVSVHIIDDLDHNQLFDEVDTVLPILKEFSNPEIQFEEKYLSDS